MKKTRQHYVWRYYLKPWSTNKKIYCLRGRKIFNSNLMGVANKRDFYRLKELTQSDIELIITMAGNSKSESHQILYLDLANQFNSINNYEENLHCYIENMAIKHIDSILRKNIDFYKSDNDSMGFLYFLCVQYMRTNKIESNIASEFGDDPNIDIEKIWNVLRHIYAYNMSEYFFSHRNDFKMLLVLNNTVFPLITGDQPVINTYAVDRTLKRTVDKLEFYYPVSPSLAILLTEKKEYSGMEKLFFEEEDVCLHNSYIVKESHEQIYSNSKESLETYM